MELKELIAIQKSGALRVVESDGYTSMTVGGTPVTDEQCNAIAKTLGWTGRSSDAPCARISKVDHFIKSVRAGIDSPTVLEGTQVYFESIRRNESEQITDRIKLVSQYFDLTLIHGGVGLGGAYALFDVNESIVKPVFSCRSVKVMLEYINNNF